MKWLSGWTSQQSVSRSPSPDSDLLRPPPRPSEHTAPWLRTQNGRPTRIWFGTAGAGAIGRPSRGGILTKSVNAVDLIYLQVSRSETTFAPDSTDPVAEEDAWCDRLRQLGPSWWRNEAEWLANGNHNLGRATSAEQELVYIGWPSNGNGVWMLKCLRKRPADFGAYDMCLNMDERCDILQKHGADFFTNSSDCIEVTEHYEGRFRKERAELDPHLDELRTTSTFGCGGDGY